ncbi:tyrosine-type recombinase/integrase [Serpentinicella alkaliphila]|uniref:Integrase-like protein n=1 Tax=Serpentinicella alkaliphila TaxID=1734049 RepID=A0A4R2TNR6_9FIRM|nr:phage integrase N-terminal SAM-like domain-containing protein [Serpentinicella alkaliphila]TCQ02915.1 integrase-like protein [Serpentinicella alkaliphila]
MKNQTICLQLEKALKLKGYSANTVDTYVSHIKQFMDYCKEDIRVITSEDVHEYLLYLLEDRGLSASYVNTAISAIKFMLNRYDINISISRVKKEKKLPNILSQEEVGKILM